MAYVRPCIVVVLTLVAAGAPLPVMAQSVAARPKAAAASAETKAAEAAKAYATGLKAFENGKPAAAITALSTAIASGGLQNPELAKAMFYRGVAQRTEKKPAAALSDLNAAVWLRDGLSATDKAVAEDHRQALLREVGGSSGVAPVANPASPAQAETLPWATAPSAEEPAPVQELTTAALPAATPVAPTPDVPAASVFETVGQATGAFFGQLFGGGSTGPAPQGPETGGPSVQTGLLDGAASVPVAGWTATTEAATAP